MNVNAWVKVFCVVLAALYLQIADAAITAWTEPVISGAEDGNGTLSVAEDQPISTTIETYAATSTEALTYSLVTAVSPFALSTSGDLTITAALDYETTKTYTLHVKAVDAADPVGSGTATITVTVTDVNEADPVFSASYSPCILDGSAQDTTLTTVAATDADTDDTITFAIASGNTASAFKITAGLIQVNTGKTLDKATTASYDLVVKASDDGSPVKTATTTVSVTVAKSCSNGAIAVAFSLMTLLVALFVTMG